LRPPQKEQALAFGKPVPSGFVVCQGSTAMREGSPDKKRDRSERDRLVAQGVLVPDDNPTLFRFSVDHVFSSQSRAAGVVIDGNSNGGHWRPASMNVPIRTDAKGVFTRAEIEGAMDAFDRHDETGENSDIFSRLRDPRDFWVRSSRERRNRVYPSKHLVGFILKKTEFSGGWRQQAAASRLHNSGFIIVDRDDKPIVPPEHNDHLISDADRIRLCALNYFVEPARERGAAEVAIRASEIAEAMGLRDRFPTICSALGGEKFQQLVQVPPPSHTKPNPSSSTIFTYKFALQAEAATVTDATKTPTRSATNLIFYGPPGTGKTYRTAWEAVRLCLGDQVAVDFQGSEKREALMDEYRRLASEGRIEFVTFHQSMSYEEFVEGLRPSTGDDAGEGPEEVETSSGFCLKPYDGVFKRVSERARLDQGGGIHQRGSTVPPVCSRSHLEGDKSRMTGSASGWITT
jgi:5-methylcytosine-specific restriction protein B